MTIKHKGKPIEVIALVDSGAEGNYLHADFVRKHNIETHKLNPPVYVKNVDGTINKQGIMSQATIVRMETGNHKEDIECAVTNIGNHKMLLGTDWLATHNPEINWTTHTISFSRCPKECKNIPKESSYIRHLLPGAQWEPPTEEPMDEDLATFETNRLHWHHMHKYEGAIDIWCPS